jgi:rod shape determining protein RodA
MKNKKIILTLILMMLFSLINNYFARNILDSYNNYFIKELVWYLISFLVFFIINKYDLNFILKHSLYLYLSGNLLLLYTLFKGNNINGSTSWLNLGFFSLQPSEFMKIFLILYLKEFSLKYVHINKFKYLIFTFIIVLIPSILTFLEPDTGGVIIYFIIYLIFLSLKRYPKWFYISSLSLCLILLFSFFYLYYYKQNIFINLFGTSFFYRMDRLNNFKKGDGYQINKALYSISKSGFTGKSFHYFPEAATDFAFTLLINSTGLIGMIAFLIGYSCFFYYLLSIKSNKYLSYSLIFILLFQYSVNILMNIGLFPIMGITLPFLSYGGSNLLSYFILLGLTIKIK